MPEPELLGGQAAALAPSFAPGFGPHRVLEALRARRSQRTRSVLTFFAEDAGTHTLLYANADLSKAS